MNTEFKFSVGDVITTTSDEVLRVVVAGDIGAIGILPAPAYVVLGCDGRYTVHDKERLELKTMFVHSSTEPTSPESKASMNSDPVEELSNNPMYHSRREMKDGGTTVYHYIGSEIKITEKIDKDGNKEFI